MPDAGTAEHDAVELEIKPTSAMLIRVLVVFFIGVGGVAVLSLLLAGGASEPFARRTVLTTYMPDAQTLARGSAVRLSGVEIGKVRSVELSGLLDPQRAIRVRMRVLARFLKSIPADSRTDVGEDTIVGNEFVDIAEGMSPLPVVEDGTLQSEPLKQAIDRADLMATLQRNLTQVDEMLIEVSSGQTKIGKFVMGSAEYDNAVSGIRNVDTAIHTFITPRSQFGQALYSARAYDDIEKLVTGVDRSLASIQAGQGTVGRLFSSDEQYDAIVRQLSSLRSSLADANAGKGRFAGLLHDDESYRAVARLLASTDSLLSSLAAGEGRAGNLLTNAQLYESVNGSLRSLENLLHDVREHPQKYLRYKVF